MPSYRFPRIRSTEITPEEVWQTRRHWMKAAGATFATGALGGWSALASAAAAGDPRKRRNHLQQFF
jgi:hypothetical protein